MIPQSRYFTRADKLPYDPRIHLSRIFAEGFYNWMKKYSADVGQLAAAFEHAFIPKHFYVALDGGEIAAMAAITQNFSPIELSRREFVRTMGFLRGNYTYCRLRKHMIRNSYPFPLSDDTGTIEFVATAPTCQNQGIAHALLQYLIAVTPYNAYILEVADTNAHAVKLYTKLGFKEMKRIKAPWRSGVNHFIYMRNSSPSKNSLFSMPPP